MLRQEAQNRRVDECLLLGKTKGLSCEELNIKCNLRKIQTSMMAILSSGKRDNLLVEL